jgi:predicted neuraminidase
VLHVRQPSSDIHPAQAKFEVVGQLPLGWLWNLSHLVRHAPLPLADGGMVLPLHFELGKHYPVFAWFSPSGEFQGLRRLAHMRRVLQPAVIAIDANHWQAYMRSLSPHEKVSLISSADAGSHWSEREALSLSNQDSAVAAVMLPGAGAVMARNPYERGRSLLVMHNSVDGLQWSAPQTLVDGLPQTEYSYPSMSWSDDRLWVSYTELRQGIAWQRWRAQPAAKAKP